MCTAINQYKPDLQLKIQTFKNSKMYPWFKFI